MQRSVSVIIPVYEEARTIRICIARLRRVIGRNPAEVIVVDGHPGAGTLAHVDAPDIVKRRAPKGRGAQMNSGAETARNDILLFLHADTFLPDDAMGRIQVAMQGKDVAGGAFDLGIDSQRPVFRLIERVVRYRTRLTKIPYGDQGIFIDRRFFHRIGGFQEIPLMEDVELMRRVKRSGKKIVIIPSPVRTSPRRWERDGVVQRTLRNWFLISAYRLGADPRRLSRFYGCSARR